MPVHYELAARPDAEHVVLITLDRPEAKNACDLDHFHQMAQAWKRFESDDRAWVAIFTGVGRSFMSGADLKTYVPEITALAKELNAGTATSVHGYSLSDGTDAGRALARVRDTDLLADAESRELVGQVVSVSTDGKRNEARW